MPLWQLALAWTLSNPMVCCALLGPSNRDQVKALSDIADIQIDTEFAELVNSINPPGLCLLPNS